MWLRTPWHPICVGSCWLWLTPQVSVQGRLSCIYWSVLWSDKMVIGDYCLNGCHFGVLSTPWSQILRGYAELIGVHPSTVNEHRWGIAFLTHLQIWFFQILNFLTYIDFLQIKLYPPCDSVNYFTLFTSHDHICFLYFKKFIVGWKFEM